MSSVALRFGVALLALCIGGWVRAHELWLMPSTFEPEPGQSLAVDLRVGAGWPGESMARQPQQVLRMGFADATGEHPLPSGAGVRPAAHASARRPGAAWLVYRSTDIALELDAASFELYLREEGLDHVLDARRERGHSLRPGRESYSRCAKTLVSVGGNAQGFDRELGLSLELVLLSDPTQASRDQPFVLKLLYRGKPIESVLVKALPQDSIARPTSARTTHDGIVRLNLGTPGVWLLNAVHMTPASVGIDADWESLWSSLTLRVGPRPRSVDGAP
jgi:uncharacterized GH25 family protein